VSKCSTSFTARNDRKARARELLGISIDVGSEGALTGRFGDIVRKEAVPL
jgi:hypothetical protein